MLRCFTVRCDGVGLILTFRWPCIAINSYNKTNYIHWFLKFIFGIKLYMFRTVSLSIIRSSSLYTQLRYISYSLRAGSGRNVLILLASCQQTCMQWYMSYMSSCSQAVSKPLWHIPLLCVQWKTPDDGQMNCPKHVEFYSKNKFEVLMYLVGFIIRI